MTTILLKRSNITGNVPAVNELQEGELGLNTTDIKLFTKNNLGAIIDLFYRTHLTSVVLLEQGCQKWDTPAV